MLSPSFVMCCAHGELLHSRPKSFAVARSQCYTHSTASSPCTQASKSSRGLDDSLLPDIETEGSQAEYEEAARRLRRRGGVDEEADEVRTTRSQGSHCATQCWGPACAFC